jgi:hypothetical protein
VDDEQQRRIARNETLLQEVNEAIERGLGPEKRRARTRFRCECARLDCNETVELTVAEFEHVHQDPRRFVIVAEHEIAEVEALVEAAPGYVVVEKRDVAGASAEDLDPRG